MFENRKLPLLPHSSFLLRMFRGLIYGLCVVIMIITMGMLGFHYIEKLAWIDAFLGAAMFFGGLGPEFQIMTWWGKLFAGSYAILCPFALFMAITMLLLPLLHRFMHRFHLEIEKD